ncbi:MAG: alkaline phosphatase [Flavobacteriales bacterium]|nr:alkaline phosphatase [Flavobacteriales bacterium]
MTNRRNFFKNTGLLTLGGLLINPFEYLQASEIAQSFKNKKAKNIIFMVSDGMSQGTLTMANVFSERKYGRNSHWIQLYKDQKAVRGLMDTASANSIVTDSAAGGSSWGGGFRVNNGSLNISPTGENNLPVLQKFKQKGKKVGCVTTVPITHATPASFCVNQNSRSSQEEIAEDYLQLRFDVMMGGGAKYFEADQRKDKKDMPSLFTEKGFTVVRSKKEMNLSNESRPVLGLFAEDGLPFSVDYNSSSEIQEATPTLAEMTQKAIELMKNNKEGFALQVEAGKVDWAAHSNDIGGLLYDQLAFDDAIKTAIDFAEKDGETLVIITTDHGNSNPGLIYGDDVTQNFDNLYNFKHSNDYILQRISAKTTVNECKELFESAQSLKLSDEEVNELLGYYQNATKEFGVYNYKKMPFELLAQLQKAHTSVGWISMTHSGDHVEVAAYGPGSHLLKPFTRNTDLHYLMLDAAEIENKF